MLLPVIPTIRRGGFVYPYTVDNSVLMTRDGAGSRFTFTPTYSGNRTKWTFRTLFKMATVGVEQTFLSTYYDTNNNSRIRINTSGKLNFWLEVGGSSYEWRALEAIIDTTGWYDIELQYDYSRAAGSVVDAWVNGVKLTAYSDTIPSGLVTMVGYNACGHYFGQLYTGAYAHGCDGNLADTCLVSGYAPGTPRGGEFRDGVWVALDPEDRFDFTSEGGACYLWKYGNAANLAENSIALNPTTFSATQNMYQRTDTPMRNQYAASTMFFNSLTYPPTYNNTYISRANATYTVSSFLDKPLPSHGQYAIEFQNKDASTTAATGMTLYEYPNGQSDIYVTGSSYRRVVFNHHDGRIDFYEDTTGTMTSTITGLGVIRSTGDYAALGIDMSTGTVTYWHNGVKVRTITQKLLYHNY